MFLFDFHHHHENQFGIYNKPLVEDFYEGYYSVGIHPKDISNNWKSTLNFLKIQAEKSNCLTIGECGLDGLIEVNLDLQKEVFKEHIILANYLKKPLTIHCVKRFSELIPFKKTSSVPMIIHGFNKKQNIFREMIQHGFYLSFGKALLQNVSLQNSFKECPIDQFFLETDDSQISILEIYQKAAELKGLSLEEIQNQIKFNLENITRI